MPYWSNRRTFLKQLGAAGIAALPAKHLAALAGTTAATETSPAAPSGVKNRAPLAANAFYPLPLGSVRPTGWLRQQLQIQADGLGGHLDETWPDVGPNSGWLGGSGESWERGPYFLDGLVPLAYLLDDARLKSESAEVHRLDPDNIRPNRHDRPRDQRRLVAANGDAEGASAVSGSYRRSARYSAHGALLCVSSSRIAESPTCATGANSAGKTNS